MSDLLVFGRTGQVARELQHLASVRALGRETLDLAQPGACAAATGDTMQPNGRAKPRQCESKIN